MHKTFDFVVVGAGTAGCVVAHKLSEAGHSVIVIESGPQVYDEQVMTYAEVPNLLLTERVSKFHTTKQPHLEGRETLQLAGTLVSGSSAVNFGNWTRCSRNDYDTIATLVKDDRWSYEGLLPYFQKTETHYDSNDSADVHGFGGPVPTTKAASRNYPLQQQVHDAFRDAGIPEVTDINNGDFVGFGPFVENWYNGRRQPAEKVFGLQKALLLTETTVKWLILEKTEMKARGVELITGEQIFASKEVILCAGAIGSAKLLMLSGIGPSSHLSSLEIPLVADLPVGQNLHDHMGAALYWKLRHPEKGLTVGHPKFDKPEYFHGNPIEWIATVEADQSEKETQSPDVEMFAAYAPIFAHHVFGDKITELLGTHIVTPVLGLKPRSRGSIILASRDASAEVIIDPNYLSNDDDLAAFRIGFRYMFRAMLETASGREMIVDETPPPGMPKLTVNSTDAEIDARVRRIAASFWQLSGTASMGKVVDSQLRVYEIQQLRVVDASIFPIPLTGHYQCPVYAMAQLAADLILASHAVTASSK